MGKNNQVTGMESRYRKEAIHPPSLWKFHLWTAGGLMEAQGSTLLPQPGNLTIQRRDRQSHISYVLPFTAYENCQGASIRLSLSIIGTKARGLQGRGLLLKSQENWARSHTPAQTSHVTCSRGDSSHLTSNIHVTFSAPEPCETECLDSQ